MELKALVEAALFVADRPIPLARLAQALGFPESQVVETLGELAAELDSPERGLELAQETGGYVLRVKGGLAEKVRPFGPHQDIPEPVLRTLAVIVAKAPVAQAEVVKLRGQRAYSHIRELISRGFVQAQDQGQTKILTVTDDLLAYFGAQKLEDLQARLKSAQPPASLVENEPSPY